MNNKDKNNNMKIILTSIVTVVIAILLLTTTNQAETIQSESPITDAQNNCFQVTGSFESQILPPEGVVPIIVSRM